jgi:KUP system potassium uptake protein
MERFSDIMAVSVTSTEAHDGPAATGFWALTLGSIGVVFGDIGTSPLYAFREALAGAAQGQPITRLMVLGVLSLILWALFIVVTAKYVLLLLRADNNGEGGTLSLMRWASGRWAAEAGHCWRWASSAPRCSSAIP